MTPKEELLQIQKTITENIQKEIQSYHSGKNRQFRLYEKRYQREFKNFKAIITRQSLTLKIIKSDIVFVGDYHTLNQSQKTLIKILRDVVPKRNGITIALEMVHHEKQDAIDAFMGGGITEEEFLKRIDYYKSWGFPWLNYKPIFDFAKMNNIRVMGINCSEDTEGNILEKRDSCAAKLIVEESINNPGRLVIVLYGDLHIAFRHIPKKTLSILSSADVKRRYIIVYQNSEKVYWKLAEEGREQLADVVKVSPHKYCIMNTPPWIKLQTYLNWIEQSGELILTPKDDEGYETEPLDYYHQVLGIVNAIAKFLGFKVKYADQFHVYSAQELEFIDFMSKYMKGNLNLSLKEIELIRAEIIYEGICLIPEEKVIYLSNLSINKVSEKAAQLLSFISSNWKPVLGREGDRNFFYSRVLKEMVGYIGSKVINFKRKADRAKDFKKFMTETKGQKLTGKLKDYKSTAKLVVKHKRYEANLLKKGRFNPLPSTSNLFRQNPRIFLSLTKSLGFMLGNKMFAALMKGSIDKAFVRKLFSFRAKKRGDSFRFYMEIVSRLKGFKEKYGSKSERF